MSKFSANTELDIAVIMGPFETYGSYSATYKNSQISMPVTDVLREWYSDQGFPLKEDQTRLYLKVKSHTRFTGKLEGCEVLPGPGFKMPNRIVKIVAIPKTWAMGGKEGIYWKLMTVKVVEAPEEFVYEIPDSDDDE